VNSHGHGRGRSGAGVLSGTHGVLQSGWRPPANAVELAFPLRGGPYLILNGGRNELINAHLATLQGERFRPWRGQSYGVDIVKLDGRGFRARGILPADPSRYAIFGEPLYSPCSGAVLAAVDGVPDMPPPRTDRRNMAGNHVTLDCGSNVWVLLGHMQRGSVLVHQGEGIVVGQRLGRVGNTGNTNEPHLHIHAQRPGTRKAPLSGDPLPIRFGDRFPVRNALFSVLPATPSGAGLSVGPDSITQ
jgi:murein DD-endopeptidase MepM/ murein hydrolase activator NlpD